MIKNVVLDMGGVCCRWDPDYLAGKLTDDLDEQMIIKKELFGSSFWQDHDKGILSSNETLEKVLNNVDSKYHQILTYSMNHWYDYFYQFDDMYELVKELKEKDIPVYLLSNCSLQFDQYSKDRPIFSLMDGLYVSARYQLLKPSKEIYQDFASRFNVSVDECLFVDDMLVNVEGAIKAGMQSYHYQGDINKFRTYLKDNLTKF